VLVSARPPAQPIRASQQKRPTHDRFGSIELNEAARPFMSAMPASKRATKLMRHNELSRCAQKRTLVRQEKKMMPPSACAQA